MWHIKWQYFLLYHIIGALFPFIGIYFREIGGFSQEQVGWTMAISSTAVLFTPAIITLLADGKYDPRRILAGLFLIGGIALVLIGMSQNSFIIIAWWTLFSFSFSALVPLSDGINFAISKRREEKGLPVTPFHRIRVWGTIGFIIPSIIIFVLLRYGLTLRIVLIVSMTSSLLGLLNAFYISDPRKAGGGILKKNGNIPTFLAAKRLLRPGVIVFCISMAFAQLASAAFYAFYPIYLHEKIGVAKEWIGLLFNIGVVIEIFFMLTFAWFKRVLGLKTLLVVGLMASALRMGLLVIFPSVSTAVMVQFLHGFHIMAVIVAPPIFLNSLADDRDRNSIQGVYTMLIYGVFRIIGSFVAGQLAGIDLVLCFVSGSVLACSGVLVLLLFFKPEKLETAVSS